MTTITPQKITPCLWFDSQAEEAARFYVDTFGQGRIVQVSRYSEAGPGEPGAVMMVVFELHGQEFSALNGGPAYRLTPAVSLFVRCDTQQEVDRLWARLGEGGRELQCGWVTDRFGVTWQVVPQALIDLMSSDDPELSRRVMEAMQPMTKIDIAALRAAAAG